MKMSVENVSDELRQFESERAEQYWLMKTLKALKITCLAALLAGAVPILSGCGGGGATFHAASDKTLGQELQDLKASYDKGILTQKEYEDTKKRLIKRYTQ